MAATARGAWALELALNNFHKKVSNYTLPSTTAPLILNLVSLIGVKVTRLDAVFNDGLARAADRRGLTPIQSSLW